MFKSATIKGLVKEATNYGRNRPYDVLFIEGGICDITTTNWSTNQITFDWEDPKRLSDHIIKNEMITVERSFKKE